MRTESQRALALAGGDDSIDEAQESEAACLAAGQKFLTDAIVINLKEADLNPAFPLAIMRALLLKAEEQHKVVAKQFQDLPADAQPATKSHLRGQTQLFADQGAQLVEQLLELLTSPTEDVQVRLAQQDEKVAKQDRDKASQR